VSSGVEPANPLNKKLYPYLVGAQVGLSARHRCVAAPSATAHTALTIATRFVRCVHLLGAQVSGIKILRIFPNILKVWNLTCAVWALLSR
jgi:hypothetical protein